MFEELLKFMMTFKTTENQYVSAKAVIQVYFSTESKENVITFGLGAMVHARRPSDVEVLKVRGQTSQLSKTVTS